MRIAICDDLVEQLNTMEAALTAYFKLHPTFVKIEAFQHAFDFLDAQSKHPFDLVLLDICMPGMLGTEVAQKIRNKNQHTAIIFITTSQDFALEAFELNALHYVIKPFTSQQFNMAIDRAMASIQIKVSQQIQLKCPKGVMQVVDVSLIAYIEGFAHRQEVMLVDGSTIDTVQTLSALYDMLESITPGQFIIPYKGFIVNQQSILKIESHQMILKSERAIPIPRRKFQRFKQVYFDYMFKGRP